MGQRSNLKPGVSIHQPEAQMKLAPVDYQMMSVTAKTQTTITIELHLELLLLETQIIHHHLLSTISPPSLIMRDMMKI